MLTLNPDHSNEHILHLKNGDVMAYASIGSCPIFYLTANDSIMCPGCVQESIADCGGEIPDVCNPETDTHIVSHHVNYKNDSLYCDACDETIESANGEPSV